MYQIALHALQLRTWCQDLSLRAAILLATVLLDSTVLSTFSFTALQCCAVDPGLDVVGMQSYFATCNDQPAGKRCNGMWAAALTMLCMTNAGCRRSVQHSVHEAAYRTAG